MRDLRIRLLIISTVAIWGCDTEQVGTSTLCTTVENSRIQQGETGFRSVNRTTTDGKNVIIGYTENNTVVPHSECTAAKVEYPSNGITFSWFLFGQMIENDEVHSIRYYTNVNQLISSQTTRLPREGRWQNQWVEDAKVTKQEWLNEPFITSVVAQNNFEGDGVKQTVITIGKISKTKRFNSNTSKFDCIWNDDGVLTVDTDCTNEAMHDLTIVGTALDSDGFLNTLETTPITYELDRDELWKDINRYW
ncbi:hypothetical protein VTH8203_01498 [Vibrio thalassae]|uniref:Uncharacterized protein n=1 Tax=Vibrio thalassae TaxID=1243014 RepID=A0A240EI17_9VIBR|nr:hypothetical protein [Vibrio thalassae]SNX47883.1 hypothetical protein VTH8203_01498 [Vibrio thalassae]